MNPRVLSVIAAVLILSVLTGCQRKFTRDRYEMLQIGVDTREDVRHVLGKPASDLDDQWFYDDVDRHYSAVVYFDQSGRLTGKEWIDARTGTWEGRNPHADGPPRGDVRERRKKTTRIDDD